ncbi:ABC transporter permease [Agrobacterium tumefaciens]|uniref:ABC transporter permease n=1 Tax=Agrobacterium tumefaciens TaxID=358 RepID=UPI00287EFEB1|nr:ABC transporter permease [Agrobacterium tumefaciens]MDS7594007.1 ABC transporter permease [Agrobacterium tumefaciens]
MTSELAVRQSSGAAAAQPACASALAAGFRADRKRQRLISVMLIGPLVAFIVFAFVLPLGTMLFYAVNNPEVRNALPQTLEVLKTWDGSGPPPAAAFDALVADIKSDVPPNVLAEAGRRLNYEITGFRSLLAKTVRNVRNAEITVAQQHLSAIDEQWNDPAYWRVIKRNGSALTAFYLLSAVDLRPGDEGGAKLAPPEERLFLSTLMRTLVISTVVTLICVLLAYPIANAVVSVGGRFSAILLACVLLPFWTSLLVRTSAWIVILQKEGIVNRVLQALGLTDAPLELVFNRTGLYIAMVHILLPFMVLPLISVMKGISPTFVRASSSLGAGPLTTFLRVYLPLTLPGVGAGCLLTFIIAAGYYVTPTLVGGASDQMLSYFVAFYANTTINWGMSAALGVLLLSCILALYIIVGRIVGIDRIVGME